jgi:translation initiation factor IF-1
MTFRPVALAVLLSLASAPPCGAGVVRGVVLETKSGRPVAGARAYSYVPGQVNTVQTQAMTDTSGVFWLNNVPAGVVTLRVQAPWHDPWAGTVSMGGETDTEKVEARVARVPVPGTISGLITFEGGAKPGRHAHIRVKGTDLDGTADDLGQFAMYGLPVGPQTLEFVALGYDVVPMPVLMEEGRNNVIHADLGHSLVAGGTGPKPTAAVSLADTVGSVRFTVVDTSKTPAHISNTQRHVTVEILSGDKVVRKLMDWATPPGLYTVTWDGRDDTGKPVSAGTYHYRAKVDQDQPIEGDFIKH